MKRGTKVIAWGLTALVLSYLGFTRLMHWSMDGAESDNVGDLDDAPDWYVSDPSLTRHGSVLVQQRADPAQGEPLGARYFIRFADGRFAWGLASEEDGSTRPLYTDGPVAYQIYWHEDAWKQWYATPDRFKGPEQAATAPVDASVEIFTGSRP